MEGVCQSISILLTEIPRHELEQDIGELGAVGFMTPCDVMSDFMKDGELGSTSLC
jgi:hypothetical protein